MRTGKFALADHQVGSADAGRLNTNEDFALFGRRYFSLFDPYFVFSTPDRCFHSKHPIELFFPLPAAREA
jgi:hypothetical protein